MEKSKRQMMEQATFGMVALSAMMHRAIEHAAELNSKGVSIQEARDLYGFSSESHARYCGYDPRVVYDSLDAVIQAATATRNSLARHLDIKPPEADLPRTALIPVDSDELHLLMYSYVRCAAEYAEQYGNSVEAYMKFITRASDVDLTAMQKLADKLSTLHDSVCTGEN